MSYTNTNVISQDVNAALNYIIEKELIKQSQWLAIAPIGSMNYNLFINGVSDIDVTIVTLPTFDELCFYNPANYEINLPNGNIAKVKDIRTFCKALEKGSHCELEVLTSHWLKVNPLYEYLWDSNFSKNIAQLYDLIQGKLYRHLIGQSIKLASHNDPKDDMRAYYFYNIALDVIGLDSKYFNSYSQNFFYIGNEDKVKEILSYRLEPSEEKHEKVIQLIQGLRERKPFLPAENESSKNIELKKLLYNIQASFLQNAKFL